MRVATVSFTLAMAIIAGPASAESWTGDDRSGDVRSVTYSPDPKPCGKTTIHRHPDNKTSDIVALTVDHGIDAVVIELSLRDLKPRQRFDATFNVRTDGQDFLVSITKFKGHGRLDGFFTKEPKPAKPDKCGRTGYALAGIGCDGLVPEQDPIANLIRVTVPRSCLKKPEWVRVGASIYGFMKPNPYDQWGRKKDRPKNPNALVGPLGPRVRREAS